MAASNTNTPIDGEVLERLCEKHGSYTRTYRAGTRGAGIWVGSCEPCAHEREAEHARQQRAQTVWELHGQANIPARYKAATFDTYEPRTQLQAAALQACRAYVAGVERHVEDGICLTLIGPPGTGKTHLLCAIAHELIDEHLQRIRYCSMADFLGAIKGCWAWHGDTEEAQRFVRERMLIVDELWAPTDERARESMMTLLDGRYRECLPTLLASNLTVPQIMQAFGERFVDRLREGGGKVLALDGKSRR